MALLDTFATASLNELDYINEAANQQRYLPGLRNSIIIERDIGFDIALLQ